MYTVAHSVALHCRNLDRVRLPHVLSIAHHPLGVLGQRAAALVAVVHTHARAQLCSLHATEVHFVHPCLHQRHARSPLVVSCAFLCFDINVCTLYDYVH